MKDGSAGGTRAAHRAVKNGFREVISSYRFYIFPKQTCPSDQTNRIKRSET